MVDRLRYDSSHYVISFILASYPGGKGWEGKESVWYPLSAHVLNFLEFRELWISPLHVVYDDILQPVPDVQQ